MHVFFTPDEAVQVINKCKEHLIKEGVCTTPFSVHKIRGGALKDVLIPTNHMAPMEVKIIKLNPKTFVSHQ